MNEVTKQEVSEAFVNLGKMISRLSSDDSKRLAMLSQVIAKYLEQVEDRLQEDDFDIDGRC